MAPWWSTAAIGLFLSPVLESVAVVLGFIARRHIRGQDALASSILLLIFAIVVLFLALVPSIDAFFREG